MRGFRGVGVVQREPREAEALACTDAEETVVHVLDGACELIHSVGFDLYNYALDNICV